MRQGQVYRHNKTGNEYIFFELIGFKVWKFWFYFVSYRKPNKDFNFIRTRRAFIKKFTQKSDLK